jgi:hypothetical protein
MQQDVEIHLTDKLEMKTVTTVDNGVHEASL